MAEDLNGYFNSVYTREDISSFHDNSDQQCDSSNNDSNNNSVADAEGGS